MQKLALGRGIDFHLRMRFLAPFLLLALIWATGAAAQEAKPDAQESLPAPTPASETTNEVAADPFADPMIRDIQDRHEKGVEGDKKAVTQLVSDLEKLTQEHPDNHLLQAYLGSAYTLASRDAFPGPGKLKYLKLGLQTMDAAVEAAPKDVAVRFIRAVNNYSMPFFVNRKDSARNDFEILVKEIQNPATAASLNTETKQAIYYYAGIVYRQLHQPDDSHSALEAGLALGSDTPLGKKIALELARK